MSPARNYIRPTNNSLQQYHTWNKHEWCLLTQCHQKTILYFTFNSSRVNPRPARTLVLYRTVGHLTDGRRGPQTGLGAMRRALTWRALRLWKQTYEVHPTNGFFQQSGKGLHHILPAELSGRLVEPGTNSTLPVFMKVGVQNHAIPVGSHDCSLLLQTICNSNEQIDTFLQA